MLKTARRINGRQKRNLALLLIIPLLLFFMWDAISGTAVKGASGQQAYLSAERTAAHVDANRAVYDMLKNAAPHYTTRDILKGADVEVFRGYFGPRPAATLHNAR